MKRDAASGSHGVGYRGHPFLNRAGKHDANTHHDRLDWCASCCTCSFVASRMRRRIVSWEAPYSAATVRSGSLCSRTRCSTVDHSEAGILWAGCFGPGRRCFITTGGVLPAAVSSSASRCWTFWYSLPDGARKRYKIGDSVADSRRFRFDYLFIFLVLLELLFFWIDVSSLRSFSRLCVLTYAL